MKLQLAHALRVPFVLAIVLTAAACGRNGADAGLPSGVDPVRRAMAIEEVQLLKSKGQRVWCVPFARNASGIDLRGNAATWWGSAKGEFPRSRAPAPGAVMVFSSTGRLPLGHLAVVSKVVSDREILVDHANWEPNQISLGMAVIDVSDAGDWSKVRVRSQPDAFGSVYAVSGFIFPNDSNVQ